MKPAARMEYVADRLHEMAFIADAWRPAAPALEAAHALLMGLLFHCQGVPRPVVHPTTESGVQATWIVQAWTVQLVFAPDGQDVRASAENIETLEKREEVFRLEQDTADEAFGREAWQWVAKALGLVNSR